MASWGTHMSVYFGKSNFPLIYFLKILCKTAELGLLLFPVRLKRLVSFWRIVGILILFPLSPYMWQSIFPLSLTLKSSLLQESRNVCANSSKQYFTQHSAYFSQLPSTGGFEIQKSSVGRDFCISHLNWQPHFYCTDGISPICAVHVFHDLLFLLASQMVVLYLAK